jgi:hypothetical protein
VSQNNSGAEARVSAEDDGGPLEDYQVSGEHSREMEWLGHVDGEERPETVGYIFHRDTEMIHEAVLDVEEGRWIPDLESGWELDSGETVGDAIEDIGDRLGWESLSEFADEHLPDSNGNEQH